MATVIDDYEGKAALAGYAPVWYLYNGTSDHYYQHMKDDGWLRLVIWGGQGWAAKRDGSGSILGEYYYQYASPFIRRSYRIEIQRGDVLRMRVGGRATKTGGTGGWESTGDNDDMYDGLCQVGGYPDGGDGLEQDLLLPAGGAGAPYTEPGGTSTVTFRRNGSGGSTRVWLKRGDNPFELIIVEPGEAGYVGPANVNADGHHISHWGSWTTRVVPGVPDPVPEDLGFQWDVLPSYFNNIPDVGDDLSIPYSIGDLAINRSASNFVFDEAKTYIMGDPLFDILLLPRVRALWNNAAEYHGTDPTDFPSASERPRPAKDIETGAAAPGWGMFVWEDGWKAPDGGTQKGADSVYTSFGPTGSGGGGWGGGHGGNAQYMHNRNGGTQWTGPGFSISIGSFTGSAGGRWWHDDYVLHMDNSEIYDGTLGLIGDIWPVDSNVAEGYSNTPWLYGFGAVWLCYEEIVGEQGWSIGHHASGLISDTFGNVFDNFTP